MYFLLLLLLLILLLLLLLLFKGRTLGGLNKDEYPFELVFFSDNNVFLNLNLSERLTEVCATERLTEVCETEQKG